MVFEPCQCGFQLTLWPLFHDARYWFIFFTVSLFSAQIVFALTLSLGTYCYLSMEHYFPGLLVDWLILLIHRSVSRSRFQSSILLYLF